MTLPADSVSTLYRNALAMHEKGEWERALTLYDRALGIRPQFAKAHFARAHALWNLRRADEALAAITAAIAIEPQFAAAYFNRGNMLRQQRKLAAALQDYAKAISIRPNFDQALNNRAGLLLGLKRYKEALIDLDRLIALKPTSAAAHYNRGAVLLQDEEYEQAWDSLSTALDLAPTYPAAFSALAAAAIGACAWSRIDQIRPRMLQEIEAGHEVIPPVILLGQVEDPALQRRSCEINLEICLRDSDHAVPEFLDPVRYGDCPLRIAYMSSNFGDHPVGRQIVGVLEHHDRSQCEVICLSLGKNDKSELKNRISTACEFYDLSEKSDIEATSIIRELKVHVLIDLNCQTEGWRPGISKARAAPVQVNYLGFAGSSGADFIDYVVADNHTLPEEAEPFYSERIVRLPNCFWPNDAERTAVDSFRRACGLPEQALVFCAFNNHHKITRTIFECWMRILFALPESILWLRFAPDAVVSNLRRHAAGCNIDPSRIVFAPIVSDDVHLGRHRLADLFLDTSPYNAHSSASDALWMGLPVLTLRGQSFAGRVASSMLHALDLPELVTTSLDAYEVKALELAKDRVQLDTLKRKLASRLKTCSLFNSAILSRNLEKAYRTMWSIARTGAQPHSFSVDECGAD